MATVYRSERPVDVAAIHAVIQSAFPTEAEASLVDALRESGRLIISMVAEDAGQIIGHIGFSPVRLSTQPDYEGGIGLAPLAVIPERQRQGIGCSLVMLGLKACRKAGFTYVVVLGDPGYYHRLGFARASDYGLGNEYGVLDEFMVLALHKDGIPRKTGVVRYAQEFAMVD